MAVRIVKGGLQSYAPTNPITNKPIIISSGGGGGRSSSSDNSAAQAAAVAKAAAAAAKAAAEKKAKEEAARKAAQAKADKLRQAIEAKASSQTLTGQLQSKKSTGSRGIPSQIQPAEDVSTRAEQVFYEQSTKGKLKASGQAVKKFASGKGSFNDIFSPFVSQSTELAADINPPLFSGRLGSRGTTIQDEAFLPAEFRSTKGKNTRQVELQQQLALGETPATIGVPTEVVLQNKASNVEKKLNKEFSRRVESGEFESDEELQKEFSKEFSKEFETQTSSFIRGRERTDLFSQEFTPNVENISSGVKTAGIIGLSFAGPIGAAVAGGIMVGSSIKDFTIAALRSDLGTRERLTIAGQGVIGATAGFAIGGAAVSQTGRSILSRQAIKEEARTLGKKTFEYESTKYPLFEEGKQTGEIFSVVGGRATRGASQEIEMALPSFPTSKGVTITGGRVREVTRIYDPVGDLTLKTSRSFSTGTNELISFEKGARIVRKGKGINQVTFDLEAEQTTRGTGFLRQKGSESFIEFPIVGASKRTEEGIQAIGLEPLSKKVKVEKVIINLGAERKAGVPRNRIDILTGEETVRGRLSSAGIIKEPPLRISFTDEGSSNVKIFQSSGGRKTPFSKTFGEDLKVFEQPKVRGSGRTEQVIRKSEGEFVPSITQQVEKQASNELDLIQGGRTKAGSLSRIESQSRSVIGLQGLTKTKQRSLLDSSSVVGIRTFTNQPTKSFSGIGSATKIKNEIRQISSGAGVTSPPTIFAPSTGLPPSSPFIGGGLFGRLPSFREGGGKKPKKKTKRLVGYSPSFTSINLGITGKRAYKAGSPFSGLDIRPIEGGNISIF